ncbi:hypothetical protein P255_01325 [Acinetobacter brisouii CIP 110357]|uniref:Uncharacterized protein n=1 Tax=Acinetobacter brisouii CIP 110357 TaxID=1341683 RepID=V2ULJ5_9GAMM|nr:hypothetical protein [Acinetobacter brisouii]ENV46148.1 hypothetical protein F954_02975 [Acinetobacter brisouii ANC 4119]ESK50827.1 hypothetical protein P255_01325 [Acinetobacter brisouii CIP 110357]
MSRLNRKELINLIIRIMNAEGSDAELDADIEQLIQLSEMLDVTNLIFILKLMMYRQRILQIRSSVSNHNYLNNKVSDFVFSVYSV